MLNFSLILSICELELELVKVASRLILSVHKDINHNVVALLERRLLQISAIDAGINSKYDIYLNLQKLLNIVKSPIYWHLVYIALIILIQALNLLRFKIFI